MLKKIWSYVAKRKISAALVIVIVGGGGYYAYGKVTTPVAQTRYILAQAEKGTLVTSVSGSGQISASEQVEVKAKAAGDLLQTNVKNGQEVKAGQVLGIINSRDAQKSVRDAQTNLTTAQLSLNKLKQPVDSYSLLQAENSVKSAEDAINKLQISQPLDHDKAVQSLAQARDAFKQDYEDAFNAVTNAFLNMPTIIGRLNDFLFSTEIGVSERIAGGQNNVDVLLNSTNNSVQGDIQAFQISAKNDYQRSKDAYDPTAIFYKATNRGSDTTTIEKLLSQTVETAKLMAQSVKSELNYFDAWSSARTSNNQAVFAKVKEYQTALATYTEQTNSFLNSLVSAQSSLRSSRDAVANAERSLKQLEQNAPLDLASAQTNLKERQASLAKLKQGVDPLDLRSQELAVRERQNTLADAREKLADYTIKAPFDGVVAVVNVKKGDSIGSGTSIATMISKQRVAIIALNEVDVAKVKTGQKVNVTFDAVSDLNLTGHVIEIDTLGTVSQGVVNYNVKILLDAEDVRIKPGMSVTAAIITDIRQNVVMVQSAAIKTLGTVSYVDMPSDGSYAASSSNFSASGVTLDTQPRQQTIEIGLVNDTYTEITSGLVEGDVIIERTIVPQTTQTAAQGTSLLQAGGAARTVTGGGGGGATFRAVGGNVMR